MILSKQDKNKTLLEIKSFTLQYNDLLADFMKLEL